MIDFTPYSKTPRLNREVVITEKIDGTNSQIVISPLLDQSMDSYVLGTREFDGTYMALFDIPKGLAA